MKKYASFILTIFIALTSILTVNGDSSASSGNVGGGGGRVSGGSSGASGGSTHFVTPTLSSGFVCQNRYSSINFDTGEISLNNSPVEFYYDIILKENEVLCPIRPFFEALQFTVEYDASDSTIIATRNGTTVIIPYGGHTITVNGVNYYTEYPAQIIDDITYIPASSFLNALGFVEAEESIGGNIITYTESCVTYSLSSDGTMTIEGVGIIPDYTGTEVKPWDDFASQIKKIIIDEAVTAIGSYAFNNCENLTYVKMPATITKINRYAFPNTASFAEIEYNGTFGEWNLIDNDKNSNTKYVVITYSDGYIDYSPAEDFEFVNGVIVGYIGSAPVVHIPETINNTSVTKIGDSAFEFSNCYHITIPDTVNEIGNGAFKYCSKLRTINIPYGITELEEETFFHCSSLNNIDLPETIITIGNLTFSYCSSLSNLYLPNVTAIGSMAFYECENLAEVTLHQGIKAIGSYAFKGCSKLTAINIPSSVEIIGIEAFSSCEYITDIELPKLSYISSDLFCNCYRLQNIIIPSSIEKINTGAFKNCYSLTNVYYKGSEDEWLAVVVDEDNEYLTDAAIHYNYTGTSECIVDFNTNGGTGDFSSVSVTEGSVIEIPENTPAREHYKFIGWAFSAYAEEAALLPLDKYIAEESVVLYAVWQPLPYMEATVDVYSNYSLVTANIYNAPSACRLNTAAYKNGKLVSLESRVCTKSSETFAVSADYDKIKVMLWSNSADLMPLCDASSVYSAEQEFLMLCNSGGWGGIYEALTSDIYAYAGYDKIKSSTKIAELAKEMYTLCPAYSTIDEFNKVCETAFEKITSSAPAYSGGSSGGGTSNTAESAGTIRT